MILLIILHTKVLR